MEQTAGYREVEHTADWELFVWAPDFITLLQVAAEGMYALSQTKLAPAPRETRNFELQFVDWESLLVDFLAELLFIGEAENIAFDGYRLDFNGRQLKAQVSGAPIQKQAKEIKAVTYHGLKFRETEQGFATHIVFDV